MNDEKEKMRSNQLKNKLISNIKKEPDIDMIKRVRHYFNYFRKKKLIK